MPHHDASMICFSKVEVHTAAAWFLTVQILSTIKRTALARYTNAFVESLAKQWLPGGCTGPPVAPS